MITADDPPAVFTLDEASKAGEARRVAQAMAGRLGFAAADRAKVAIVVTELATNLYKHAGDGALIVQGLDTGRAVGLEVLALDRGPGMADVGRCMADGFSTAGSPGNGLGAVARLSAQFDIHSSPESGTAVLARFWQATAAPPQPGEAVGDGLEVGALSVPLTGEAVCGDAWAVAQGPGRSVILVVDGLGHGLLAAEAAREAVATFRAMAQAHADAHLAPAEIIRAAHEALRKTRGAALAVALVDRDRREVKYAGVGNIAGVILAPREDRSTSMVSHNGTVGHTVRKVQEFIYPWDPGALLVMHSDGLATHWRIGRDPGLSARHPSLVAGVLYRDFRRGRDDATVLVAREREEERGPWPR